ncbi:MAG: hypothetical protein ACTSQI_11725 [Candidatus Helarchaeota archaeon]
MGLFSRLKEFFSGKSIESIKEFENELNKLQKKSDSEVIALIGTGGRLKGLPLIYVSNDEHSIKRYTARIAELISPLNNLSTEKSVKDVLIRFEDSSLLYVPLMKEISFFGITFKNNEVITLRNWITEKIPLIKDLFHNKE